MSSGTNNIRKNATDGEASTNVAGTGGGALVAAGQGWPWAARMAAVLFVLGALTVVLLGVFGQMKDWLVMPLTSLPLADGVLLWLLGAVEISVAVFLGAAGIWTLRRWLRCKLWQPRQVTQELLFALFVVSFGAQIFILAVMAAGDAYPVDFAAGAGIRHQVKLALLLLLGRGSVQLCLVWLWGVFLLLVCYASAGKRMRQWCSFGQVGRRVAAVTAGLLPLCAVALLFDHAARMHWKFDQYGGAPRISVGLGALGLFVVYIIAAACIGTTAGRVYADRVLRLIAFLPVLVLLLLLGGFAVGVFTPAFR